MAKIIIDSSNVETFKNIIPSDYLPMIGKNQPTVVLGAYDDETGLATGAILCSVMSDKKLTLRWIYVIAPKRGQGIGYDLLKTVASVSKSAGFEEIEYFTAKGMDDDVVKFLSDNYFYFESADKEINTILDVKKYKAEDCLHGLLTISDLFLLSEA